MTFDQPQASSDEGFGRHAGHLHAPDVQADRRQDLVGVGARQVAVHRLQPLQQRGFAGFVHACSAANQHLTGMQRGVDDISIM